MYHHINDSDGRFATSEAALDEQMAWLSRQGYASVLASDLLGAMSAGAPLPEKPVMLTIDDGNRSDLIFAAVLARHGFQGVYFWPNTSPLTPDEMVSLAARGEICAHTCTHPNLEFVSKADQRPEIVENQQRLQVITGQPVRCFAYPYGRFSSASVEVLTEQGFALAFDAFGGPTAIGDLDRLHIPRREVRNGISMAAFIALVEAVPTPAAGNDAP